MTGEVNGLSVYPQRPAEAEPWPVQQLAEARYEIEPPPDLLPDNLDAEPAIGVLKTPAVDDGERADVLRPASLLGPDHHEVLRGQAVHDASPFVVVSRNVQSR